VLEKGFNRGVLYFFPRQVFLLIVFVFFWLELQLSFSCLYSLKLKDPVVSRHNRHIVHLSIVHDILSSYLSKCLKEWNAICAELELPKITERMLNESLSRKVSLQEEQ
jgi:hypothetical protein